ncbi:GTP pyrophosphokinase [Enterobacter quasiroggenkampii]|uniref:GTP pyrophosphokinase n=1 Tax=Enterobacter quasiroggenkampii TaxID=2497436 RepID=UPI0039C0608F
MKNIVERYSILKPKYDGLMNAIKFSLEQIISTKEMSLFELTGRVKSLTSLENKIIRKGNKLGLDSIEDLCGVRVVCYYTSDMDAIAEMIHEEFNILSISDKQKEAEEDRFGYLSRHFIVTWKDEWLSAPLYREYSGLKIEIQLRTMLMHTWAAISHKLLYKNESDAPRELKRRLNRLSALIELADEQFNAIRNLKEEYIMRLQADEEDKEEPLNSDGLILLIDKYAPGREVDNESVPKFLKEIKDYKVTIKSFEEKIIATQSLINEIENKLSTRRENFKFPVWTAVGYCRAVMDLTTDKYFKSRWVNGPMKKIIDDGRDTDGYWQFWLDLMNEARKKLKLN